MSAVIETHGPMSVSCPTGDIQGGGGDASDLNWYIGSTYPKGHLKLTNLVTGATKSYSVASLNNGELIWDSSVDDPSFTQADQFEIEFSGKCQSAGVGHSNDIYVKFDGSGNAKATLPKIQGA